MMEIKLCLLLIQHHRVSNYLLINRSEWKLFGKSPHTKFREGFKHLFCCIIEKNEGISYGNSPSRFWQIFKIVESADKVHFHLLSNTKSETFENKLASMYSVLEEKRDAFLSSSSQGMALTFFIGSLKYLIQVKTSDYQAFSKYD